MGSGKTEQDMTHFVESCHMCILLMILNQAKVVGEDYIINISNPNIRVFFFFLVVDETQWRLQEFFTGCSYKFLGIFPRVVKE